MVAVLAVAALAACVGSEPADPCPECGVSSESKHETECETHEEAPERIMSTCFAEIQAGRLAANLRLFEPRFPHFTDGSINRRWAYLPPGSQLDNSELDRWIFPVGTTLWQEVAQGPRVETRVLEKVSDGVGVDAWRPTVYAWLADQSDAIRTDLVPGSEDEFAFANVEGFVAADTARCMDCHRASADVALGFSALQLSGDGRPGLPPEWDADGYLYVSARSVNMVGELEDQAVLGYLHANCGSCHSKTGSSSELGLDLSYTVGTTADLFTTNAFRTALYKKLWLTPGNLAASNTLLKFTNRTMPPPPYSATLDENFLEIFEPWVVSLVERTRFDIDEPPLTIVADEVGFGSLGFDGTIVDGERGLVFESSDTLKIFSPALIPVDTSQTYRLSGMFRSNGTTPSNVYVGLVPFDANGAAIPSHEANRVGSPATLNVAATTETTIMTNGAITDWNQPPEKGWRRALGFYFDGDDTKRADYVLVGTNGNMTDASAGGYSSASGTTVALNEPMPSWVLESLTSSTVIRNHRAAATYLYTAGANASIGTMWVELSGTISGEGFDLGKSGFRPGTTSVGLYLYFNAGQGNEDTQLLFDSLSVEQL